MNEPGMRLRCPHRAHLNLEEDASVNRLATTTV